MATRNRKPDEGHRLTDIELAKLERRISSVYGDAAKELQKTIDDYFESFAKRDKEMQDLIGTIQNGKEWTQADYQQWRLAQIGRGERFKALRDKVAQRYTQANETAVSYVNDATPGIYSLNRNYAAYTIESVAGDVGFDLWDEQTVKRIIKDDPDLMPYYPAKRALNRGIDLAYGKRQISACVTSSILQGKSIKGMADDLQTRIPTMNRDSAIRTARTAVTNAQNAGRMDSYVAATKMGIEMEREWVSALDARTRPEHAEADGQVVGVDEPFIVGGEKLMFPGDRSGSGWNIYNCRCTQIAKVKGVDTSDAKRRARDLETGESVLIENMSYAEWAGWKKKREYTTEINSVNRISSILGIDESKVKIGNLPIEAQKSIEKSIEKVVRKFPQLRGHTTKIEYNADIEAIASSKSITGELNVSKKFLDFEKLRKDYDYDVRLKWHAKGTNVDSIITHELGHQIDGLLTKNGLCGAEISMYGVERASVQIQKEVLSRLGLTDERLREIRKEYAEKGFTGKDLTHAVMFERKEFIIKNVSEYACENSNEFFAECFAEYVDSDEPREAAKIFGEILEKALGELK